jgi:hypothetical protein
LGYGLEFIFLLSALARAHRAAQSVLNHLLEAGVYALTPAFLGLILRAREVIAMKGLGVASFGTGRSGKVRGTAAEADAPNANFRYSPRTLMPSLGA